VTYERAVIVAREVKAFSAANWLEPAIAQRPAQLAVNVLLVLRIGRFGAGVGREDPYVMAPGAQVLDR
jgi:hypothetical protein